MSRTPEGTVSLLFSDIEGSTRLVHRLGVEYAAALRDHRELLRQAWLAHAGVEMGTEGDSFYVAFSTAVDAVAAAIQAQRGLEAHSWPQEGRVRVRIGIHTGSPALIDGAYVGLDVHRAARIAAAAHGGQIVVSAVTAELVRPDLPADVSLVDLGVHRLKDLPRDEHLLQVQADDLVHRFPQLRSLGAPSRLPVPLTPLIGRDEERAQVVDVLSQKGTRLLTLTGPGGSGKTRLALDVALHLNDRYPDGAYFTALESATTTQEMNAAVAQTLGLSRESATSAAPWAEASHRKAILVLDSLEQVAGATEALETLLDGAPEIVVLATSRRPLRVAGEHEHAVPTLALPDGGGLDAATRSAAIELFVHQARLVRPSFEVTEDNVADVVAICRRLDGLPLALELAGAQTRLLSPRAILRRLGGALDLTSRAHGAARQRTLRATISWSYGLLSPTLRGAFRRMGVFSGGADLPAVAAVVVEEGKDQVDPINVLEELMDASAVRIRDTPDGEPRMEMLETIRSFALDELRAKGELDRVRERHARHYLAAAHDFAVATEGAVWVAWWSNFRNNSWFETEDANLLEAVAWALSDEAEGLSEREHLGLELCAVVGDWWASRAAVERASWLERAVERAGGHDDPALSQCLLWLSWLRRLSGDWEGAQHDARACLDLSRRLQDPVLLTSALSLLSGLEMFSGRLAEASQLLEEAVEIAGSRGDRQYLLKAAIDRAVMEDLRGNHVRSLERNAEALALANQLGDEIAAQVTRHNTAYTLLLMGHPKEAEAQMRDLIEDAVSSQAPLTLLPFAEDYAAMLAAVHDEVPAVVLLGAAEGLRRQFRIPVAIHQQEMVKDLMSSTRGALGSQAWERAYQSGIGTDLADALTAAGSRRDINASGS